MTVTCIQCGKKFEVPLPVPGWANCPFCYPPACDAPDDDGPPAECYTAEPTTVRCSLGGEEFHEPTNYGE
jgi:hypothetical protein